MASWQCIRTISIFPFDSLSLTLFSLDVLLRLSIVICSFFVTLLLKFLVANAIFVLISKLQWKRMTKFILLVFLASLTFASKSAIQCFFGRSSVCIFLPAKSAPKTRVNIHFIRYLHFVPRLSELAFRITFTIPLKWIEVIFAMTFCIHFAFILQSIKEIHEYLENMFKSFEIFWFFSRNIF